MLTITAFSLNPNQESSPMDINSTLTKSFFVATDVVDYDHPTVKKLAKKLSGNNKPVEQVAQTCFEWVRDHIAHTMDVNRSEVGCSASQVLQLGHGFCYAKSHLLAALLRANGIATRFCYQRLSDDLCGFGLHGFNAIYLPTCGWYRVDARGNKQGVNAQFIPPKEQLAFTNHAKGEVDYEMILAEPWPTVVYALQNANNAQFLAKQLPDRLSMG